MDEKRQQIAEEKERLAAEKEEARQAALERKQAKKTTTLAMAKPPSAITVNEVRRDGRFIAYDNGTVLDTRTNLMWAAKDDGRSIDWVDAKKYCENYRGGGYTDWRMPTTNELTALYDKTVKGKNGAKLTNLIELSRWSIWASETRDSEAAYFDFYDGDWYWGRQYYRGVVGRVLPVRLGKR